MCGQWRKCIGFYTVSIALCSIWLVVTYIWAEFKFCPLKEPKIYALERSSTALSFYHYHYIFGVKKISVPTILVVFMLRTQNRHSVRHILLQINNFNGQFFDVIVYVQLNEHMC